MKIPSMRTRRDMETAAELRAAGASWETAAAELGRQPNLLMRWAKVYREDWERLLLEAEERADREVSNEARTALRILLRSKNSKVRLAAAGNVARHWLAKRSGANAPDPRTDHAAYLAYVEEMSDEQLEQYLAEFAGRTRGQDSDASVASPQSAAGPG